MTLSLSQSEKSVRFGRPIGLDEVRPLLAHIVATPHVKTKNGSGVHVFIEQPTVELHLASSGKVEERETDLHRIIMGRFAANNVSVSYKLIPSGERYSFLTLSCANAPTQGQSAMMTGVERSVQDYFFNRA